MESSKSRENGKLLPLSHSLFQPDASSPTTLSTGGKSSTTHQNLPVEEQPSWLDDLLNDTDTLFHRGTHRRSASDSCAYLGAAVDALGLEDESKFVNAYFGSFQDNTTTFAHTKESGEAISSVGVERSGQDSSTENVEGSADKAKTAAGAKTELKRAKQHNAQRSRVRKLQYIAHLERTIEILKAGGAGISAELEFIQQQNMILTMENRALRQRLESISQEQMIKQWEQGMLEREIGRLQSLYHLQKQQQMQLHHQQQQPHNQNSKHRQNRSRDLDDQVNSSSMAIKNRDSLNGPIRV